MRVATGCSWLGLRSYENLSVGGFLVVGALTLFVGLVDVHFTRLISR